VVDVVPNPNGGLAIVIEPPTLGVVVIVVPFVSGCWQVILYGLYGST
jgi:hypothetical protein